MFRNSLIALALAASLGTATFAAGDTLTFAAPAAQQENASFVDLGTVTVPASGTIEIHDYRAGTEGLLLGSLPVTAGVHSDLQVPVRQATGGDVLATLIVNGQIVGRQVVEIQG